MEWKMINIISLLKRFSKMKVHLFCIFINCISLYFIIIRNLVEFEIFSRLKTENCSKLVVQVNVH